MEDPNKVTYFGETDSRGERKKFGIRSIDRSKHVYVIGKTGMGKSTLLENMAIQDIQSGNGVVFIDPHGGTAEKLLEYVPEERIKDVLYFAPFDIDHPISFNIMEDVGEEKRHLVVSGLMSAFMKLFGEESFSDRMQYILQNTILALLEYPGSTMLGINKMLADKAYRTKVIANITDPSVKAYWTQEYAGYTERFAADAIPAIQNKIGQFTSNPLVRNIIGQSKSSFNLRDIMDNKKIMIVNLSKGRLGEGNARLLGSMLITKIYLAAMSRADESAASLNKLPQFYLYVDEFQSFADKSFADILSEARKYKLNLTMAHQYIEQMEEEVRDAVFGNVGTMIAFRVGAYDAEVLEKEFAPTFMVEDLVNLGLRQIYLKLMIDSVTSQPFSASTLPPIALPALSHVDEIVASSRKVFARDRAEVEKMIMEWHGDGKTPPSSTETSAAAPRKILYPKKEPKPLDTRSLEPEKPPSTSFDKAQDKPLVTSKVVVPTPPPAPAATPYIPTPVPKSVLPLPKPVPRVSLETLNKSGNNQRKPDEKHVSALRDALKSVIGEQKQKTQEKQSNSSSLPASGGLRRDNNLPASPSPQNFKAQNTGPSPEELKKLLGVE